jgi:hypothetical protein
LLTDGTRGRPYFPNIGFGSRIVRIHRMEMRGIVGASSRSSIKLFTSSFADRRPVYTARKAALENSLARAILSPVQSNDNDGI